MASQIEVAVVAVAAACAAGSICVQLLKRRSPEEAERLRRAKISRGGRIIEGFVAGARESALYYSYSWRGVGYEACQDVSAFLGELPIHAESLIGPAAVKFLHKILGVLL